VEEDMKKLNFAAIVAAGAALALSPTPVTAQGSAKPVSLGIQFSGTPEGTEAEVVKMLPDRTGAAIGFKVGDILIEAGGKPVSREVLMAYMKDKKEGDQLNFKVRRGGAVIELTGTGMAAPEGAAQMTVEPEG
jgi:S1-C subfamily serine protease